MLMRLRNDFISCLEIYIILFSYLLKTKPIHQLIVYITNLKY